jgi:ABC-2 type transport system permease protein
MNKTLLIIAREYLTRVKKKSFIVMTILGPILMAALIIVPVYISNKSLKEVKLMVVDDNDFFINGFADTKNVTFSYRSGDIEQIKKECLASGQYDAVLHILKGTQSLKSNLYYYEEPPMTLRSNLESQMDKLLFDKILVDSFNIDPAKFEMIKSTTRSSIATIQTDETGAEKKNFTELNRVIGIVCGFAIYMFIFMFASQVLRSVLEEKTNRIVEVLISSVKPVQLMMGKIVGVALVGLTQFALWVLLTLVIVLGVQVTNPGFFNKDQIAMEMPVQPDGGTQIMPTADEIESYQDNQGVIEMINAFYDISFTQIILSFLFYFLFGYLVYAALYAAVGSAVDNEADSGQFTLPVTIPLILTMVLIMPMAEDPNGSLAWWMSMIPLTSPVAMLVRLPSGVPFWELMLSMGILVLFFYFCVWFAAKIYRTGILMYGKKPSYKELWKWIRY